MANSRQAGANRTIPPRMTAVLLTGHGGPDVLELREDVPTPEPGPGEVLIEVGAAGVNNTDINTRIGWYSKKVSAAPGEGRARGFGEIDLDDATWTGRPMSFPRIQGADCCGRIVAVGSGVDAGRIGERVIVRTMLRSYAGCRPYECWTFGSECDGAFAQFARAPASETFRVRCDWTDAELASLPCSWSTAENMLHRAAAGAERVLVTGASGGVGSAAVQLARRRGAHVIVRTMLRSYAGCRPYECWTFGSECDGAFAQFARAPASETFRVRCDWTDAELASLPCSWSTAENMLHRAAAGAERVLVTGASGGVGSAAVQLARRRGAHVIAVAAQAKAGEILRIGAHRVIDRDADLLAELGPDSVDVVIDLVAGRAWPALLDLLRRGGRYACAGAIAGPVVELDLRTLYLKDLSFFGCTFQEDIVFENLVGYIERGEVRPVVSGVFPLARIAEVQQMFLSKDFVGKLVLEPPPS